MLIAKVLNVQIYDKREGFKLSRDPGGAGPQTSKLHSCKAVTSPCREIPWLRADIRPSLSRMLLYNDTRVQYKGGWWSVCLFVQALYICNNS